MCSCQLRIYCDSQNTSFFTQNLILPELIFAIRSHWKEDSGREHNHIHQWKIGLKIYWAWLCPPQQDPVFPQPVPPIRKLPQASYPYPSEGRQNENHNHGKLTKLITWVIALSNSMELWAMSCSVTQDRRVMVESFDKTWSTGEGNGKPLQYSCLENPWTIWKGKI